MRQKMWKILWSTTLTQWWNAKGSMLSPEECSRPVLNKGRRFQIQPKKKKQTKKKQLNTLSFEEQKLQNFFRQLPKFWWSSLKRITPWSFIGTEGFANICIIPFTKHQRAQKFQHHRFCDNWQCIFLKALR